MMDIFESFVIALQGFMTVEAMLMVFIGTLVGLLFGMFPGLGGPVALALLIPISFGMDQSNAMILFGSAMGGVTFGGSVTAILLNIPGTAPNAATVFDGYPMARDGRAGEAISASAVSSAIGAIVGLVLLVLLLPLARNIILSFQPPEFFWLAILGLTIIATVSDSLVKSLVSGGIGLLISFIGWSGVSSTYRYGLGTQYLYDGIPIVIALLGVFAFAEVVKLATESRTISSTKIERTWEDSVRGVRSALSNWPTIVRSSLLGTLIGLVPGAGGTVATFLSYMQAKMLSSDPDSFGKGNVQGVIASEAANDAKDGGALLPTVVFSVPGSATMVVLLGAFVLHGVTPGQQLLSNDLPILATIILALLFSNILTSLIGIVAADKLTRVTSIPVSLIIPTILAVVFVGSYMLRTNIEDVLVVIIFGILGYWMVVFGFSRVALVLGMILGPIAERGFLQGLAMSDTGYWIFIFRPISALLLIVTVVSLAVSVYRWKSKTSLTAGVKQ